MNLRNSPSRSPAWARYNTYARLAVCLLLLPLVITGLIFLPEARPELVPMVLIVVCCLYIDTDATRRFGASPGNAR